MSSSPISITVQLLPVDIHRAILWLTFRGSLGSWRSRVKIVMYVFAAAVGAFSFYMSGEESRKEVIANFGLLFWIAGFLIVWIAVAPYLSARSTFKSKKGLRDLTHYTISKSRIEMETATASHQIDWSRIARAAETKSYFYLFSVKGLTLIIPKRVLPGEMAITDLRKILQESVKGKVRLSA